MSRYGWFLSILVALGATLFLTQCGPATSSPPSVEPDPEVRAFEVFRAEEIEGPSLPDPVKVLKDGGHPGFMLVHEYKVNLREGDNTFIPTGDTSMAWVQHRYTDETQVAPQAEFVDHLLMCYPETLPDGLQSKHIFPNAEGIIYLYSLPGKPVYIASPLKAKNGRRLLDSLKSVRSRPPELAEQSQSPSEGDTQGLDIHTQ